MKLRSTFLLLLAFWGVSAFAADTAQESVQMNEERKSADAIASVDHFKRLALSADAEYSVLKSSTSSLQSIGIRVSARYALAKKWALNFGVGQGFDASGGAAIFTNFQLQASYALMGRFLNNDQDLSFNKSTFLEIKQKPRSTLSLSAGLDQYFFNSSVAAVAAPGVGISVIYSFPIWGIFMNAGMRTDFLLLSTKNLTSIGGLVGLNWSI